MRLRCCPTLNNLYLLHEGDRALTQRRTIAAIHREPSENEGGPAEYSNGKNEALRIRITDVTNLLSDVIMYGGKARKGSGLAVGLKLNRPGEYASGPTAAMSAALRGRRLFLARAVWLVISVLAAAVYVASIPAYHDSLINFANVSTKPATIRSNLEAIGVSIDLYATYLLTLSVASTMVWFAVGVVIFWRRSNDWMAVFASLSLILFGTFTLDDVPNALAERSSTLWLPVHLLGFIGSASLLVFIFLFPDGRFVPRWTRWIPVFWTIHEIPYYFFPNSVLNVDRSFPMLDLVIISTFLCIGVGSQVYRYRRVSGPVQRQQTKWVVFGMVSGALGAVGFAAPLYSSSTLAQFGSLYTFVFITGLAGSLLLIPLSIGIAILRHRLWDIDIVVNRTLVYGTLTVSLALVYLSGIVLLQRVFVFLTGEKSQLAIVASTLFIAALFSPLRHRIQSFIDRRFYRSKYDAAKTLEAFSSKLRDETDLDALSDDLVGVVSETMQPSHVSLWLRPDTTSKGWKQGP
jgi:hypothetical protein